MNHNNIGRSSVSVSELSFGCSNIGNIYRKTSDADCQAVLNHAWDSGIRYFDTAPHYGRGLSEVRLGHFLKQKTRSDYTVSSKVGRLLSPGKTMAEADGFVEPLPNDVRYDYSGDGIEQSFEQSCKHLQTSYIDILYVHDIGEYTHGEADNAIHMKALMGSGFDRLQKLKEQGRIGAFGLGVNENQVCLDIMKQVKLDVILLAGRLTLLDRSAEDELVQHCLDDGTHLVLGGIFNSGILATGPIEGATYDYKPASEEIRQRTAELEARCKVYGIPLATAAMQFSLRHRAVVSTLLGTAKVSSLERNLVACRETMPEGIETLFI